jgi:hypothetical protein
VMILLNDRGQRVEAVGGPGSRERVRCEYPVLIADMEHCRRCGKKVAAAHRMILAAGAHGMNVYEALLLEAGYEPGEAAAQGRCFGAGQR